MQSSYFSFSYNMSNCSLVKWMLPEMLTLTWKYMLYQKISKYSL